MQSVAKFSWEELLSQTGGKAISQHRSFNRVTVDTDTRTLSSGCFFIPLKGEQFDGNDYIEQAYAAGAEGCLVESAYLEAHPTLSRFPNLIEVECGLTAYHALARFHRRRSEVKVIGVTGSSGKTTVKEMLYAMLSAAYPGQVQKTEKNYNNEVGVPLTLLSIQPDTRFIVVEMAMRGRGQITLLTKTGEPDIAMVTNIGPAHIGLLGSLENIAKAKCEIFYGLNPHHGIGIINGDDMLLEAEAPKHWQGVMETFSLHDIDNIHKNPAEGTLQFDYDDVTFHLGVTGTHNVMNALAGIRACQCLGIPLKKIAHALAQFEAGGGRGEKRLVDQVNNVWVINDAYNANPSSLRVSLETFIKTPYEGLAKVAVLGAMEELGEFTQSYHRQAGEWLAEKQGLDAVILLGEAMKTFAEALDGTVLSAHWVPDHEAALSLIQARHARDTIILLKGSRAYKLEAIAQALTTVEDSHVRA